MVFEESVSADMWVPYETIRKHPLDFLVQYRFYTPEEGGRRNLPSTDLRVKYPEFEDEYGNLIMDETNK